MNNAAITTVETARGNMIRATLDNGIVLEYARWTDSRILDVSDGKVQCRSRKAAHEIAGEAAAAGCRAESWEYAVVLG